ncbi:MAG: hypothetical protein ACYC3I_26035 [Gemmataceae bacterium]
MLLAITTTHQPALDLGYLLNKWLFQKFYADFRL